MLGRSIQLCAEQYDAACSTSAGQICDCKNRALTRWHGKTRDPFFYVVSWFVKALVRASNLCLRTQPRIEPDHR